MQIEDIEFQETVEQCGPHIEKVTLFVELPDGKSVSRSYRINVTAIQENNYVYVNSEIRLRMAAKKYIMNKLIKIGALD